MKPRSPSAPHPARRGAFAVLLVVSLAAVVAAACDPRPVRAQPDKKDTTKKDTAKKDADKKDGDKKEPPKPPEVKWPTEINGKDIDAVLKEIENPDPAVRVEALQTLPGFGPATHKEKVSKLLIKRMKPAFEPDPGVRVAVFHVVGTVQFDEKAEADFKEAVRLLAETVDAAPSSSMTRIAAIQSLALFGHRGEPAITKLTGVALRDPSFETRRTIAATLGRVGFDEKSGPNMLALTKLADVLAKDESGAVRMEAMQSLMLLGPPWESVKKAGESATPPIDTKSVALVAKYLKVRVGDPKAKPPTHGLEKDKQVEIWARLVLMRFDPSEVNDDNIDALARFLTGAEPSVKVQALHALAIVGEAASRKVKDIVGVMEDPKAPYPLNVSAIQALRAIGAGAKPALPNLKKMLDEKKKPLDEKMLELKKQEAAKKPIDPQLYGEAMVLDELVRTLEAAIKSIDEAKSTSTSGSTDTTKKK